MDVGRIDGVGGVDGPHKITRITPPEITKALSSADKVDISEKAGMISKALGLPQARAERIAEVQKLIESGRFDTDARLEGALDLFLAENSDL
jgi:hypothetical protein